MSITALLIAGAFVQDRETDFSGIWNTNRGRITIIQAQREVAGNFRTGGGMIDGYVENGRVSGTWRMGSKTGTFVLHKTGAKTFKGTLNGKSWTGKKILG